MVNYIILLVVYCITIVLAKELQHHNNHEPKIITKPQPGQEYVFVQTASKVGDSRKTKVKSSVGEQFESAHKVPHHHTKKHNYYLPHEHHHHHSKREANAGNPAAPVPAGAIKINVNHLIEKYKQELRANPTTSSSTSKPKSNSGTKKRRTKKEISDIESSTISSGAILTTTKRIDEEKQRSRTQIKKGPNGQEYEYEYVYYYYDDDDDGEKSKTTSSITNVKSSTTDKPAIEVNEVIPLKNNQNTVPRGRQLNEDVVTEDRLPANTRFPPRSRNLNTTPVISSSSSDDEKLYSSSTPNSAITEKQEDRTTNQDNRNRGRTNTLRRPSLELVDNASFNTHSNSGPSFPPELPAGPVRFLGATPNESIDIPLSVESSSLSSRYESTATTPTSSDETTVTGVTSAMDKAALDLYAILQGTQKLHEHNNSEGTEEETNTNSIGKIESVPSSTTVKSISTTNTFSTSTTTVSSTPEIGARRYKSRAHRKTGVQVTNSESKHNDNDSKIVKTKPRTGVYGNRPRPHNTRTTNSETSTNANENNEKQPQINKSRYSPRPRVRSSTTPSAVATLNDEVQETQKSASRPRSNHNLQRNRIRTSTATSYQEDSSSTTAKPRIRPLRPGPRLNLIGGRGRTSTTSTTERIEDIAEEDQHSSSDGTDEFSSSSPITSSTTSTTTVDNSPLGRLKNRNRLVVHQPTKTKNTAAVPVAVRRVNPLLANRRRLPDQSTTQQTPSNEDHVEHSEDTEEGESSMINSSTNSNVSSTTTVGTTEGPRGLSKLLAGRRRLALKSTHHEH